MRTAARQRFAEQLPSHPRAAERSEQCESNDGGTVPPPSSHRGEVTVLTLDAPLAVRAQRALRGFWVVTAATLAKLPTPLPNGVLVIDPAEDRLHTVTILDVLARVPSQPTVVVILRNAEDLRIASRFSVGAIAIDAVDELLADAVERARSNRRRPRL